MTYIFPRMCFAEFLRNINSHVKFVITIIYQAVSGSYILIAPVEARMVRC